MDASIVDKDLIERINKGEEKAFEVLYNSYFVYLCACANSYIFNPVEAQDIVNETFAKIWYRRGELSFPIHAYLIRAIQNGYLQPIITQYFIDNKSEIWLLFLIAHSKR